MTAGSLVVAVAPGILDLGLEAQRVVSDFATAMRAILRPPLSRPVEHPRDIVGLGDRQASTRRRHAPRVHVDVGAAPVVGRVR